MNKPVYTDQQIADQLTRDGSYWRGDNYDNVVKYSFSSDLGDWWGNDSETPLDTVQQVWIQRALNQLEDMFDLDFQEVSQPANTENDPPIDIIQFVNDTYEGTYSANLTYGNNDIAFTAIVFDQTWDSNQSENLSYGSYGYMTMLHEILHSLGLEHPGDYNAGSGGGTITYADDAEFAQDTHQYTVMSYFPSYSDGSGAFYYDTVADRVVFPSTPMVYDILAMTQGNFDNNFGGYGANSTARNGDTTYGYNTTQDADGVYDFTVNGTPVLTLYDTDGVDTLDLSGDTVALKAVVGYDANGMADSIDLVDRTDTLIDLREGHYSSTHGMTYNMGIAFGTVIENVIGTKFNDTIHGNDVDNIIDSADGADTLYGYSGDDHLSGGNGNDRLAGGEGKDWLNGGAGTDTAVFDDEQNTFDLVRFGDVVQVFSDDPSEKDWTEAIEIFEFGDGQINLEAIQSNDIYAYLASNSDLLNAFGSNTQAAMDHYFENGYQENRTMDSFNEWGYMAGNTDILAHFEGDGAAATQHYVEHGFTEGRDTTSFEAWSYLASYSDLLPALGLSIENAEHHFANFGYWEGRVEDNFDEYLYLASNTDVLSALGYDEESATYHYLSYGINEGRLFDFDAEQYLENYSDLQSAFGDNTDLAVMHFVNNGFYEGRTDDVLIG